MRKQVLSLLVENTSGVLSHISGLFSRRGYNIDSFSAGVTADPKLQDGESVCRELILVKIKINDTQRQAVLSVANIFRAKIVDVSNDSMVIELTGGQSKLDAFLDLLRGYDILELARTGITGLSRGSSNVTIID